jgi:hypothetical protein
MQKEEATITDIQTQHSIKTDFKETGGTSSGAVVEALRYKPEGRGIYSRWCFGDFSFT